MRSLPDRPAFRMGVDQDCSGDIVLVQAEMAELRGVAAGADLGVGRDRLADMEAGEDPAVPERLQNVRVAVFLRALP